VGVGVLAEGGISMRRADFEPKSRTQALAIRSLQLSLLASVLIPLPAFAQSEIETVTVTAQRREEMAQKVPISINVLTPAKIATSGIENTLDLPQLASSLITINGANASSFQTPFIRGVGSSSTLLGIDASVATYVDGVYQPFKASNILDLDDIERVEILKGPQGTLFGRNATGGAINITTKQPTDTFTANAEASYGRYDETVERGYINGHIANDLDGNLGVVARQGGDFLFNAFNGDHFGGNDSVTVNGKLLWTPLQQLEITAGFIFNNRDQSFETGQVTMVPGSIPVGTLLGGSASFTDYVGDLNFTPRSTNNTTQVSLRAKYSFSGVDLVSISAYQFSRSHELLDYDGTSANVFSFDDFDRGETITQEVQLLSNNNGPLQWIVGGYFISDQQSYVPLGLLFVAPSEIHINSSNHTTGAAVFGQATYDFGEGTRLTGGLRYSEERHIFTGIETIPAFGVTLAGPIDLAKTFARPTWRVSVDHSFGDDLMAYVSYNRGFKSGGFNSTTIDPTQKPVNAEILDAYEAGFKSQWDNHRVQLNAAAYYYQYQNIQVQRIDPNAGGAALLESAGAAYLYGLDADLTVIPVDGLELHAGLGIEQSKYTRYDNASGYAYVGGFGVPVTINATGTQLLFAPDVTFNLGADYTWNFHDTSNLQFSANYAYSSKYKEVVGDGNFMDAYGALNGSITWNAPNDKFFLRLWGRNLTDQHDVGRLLSALYYEKQLLQPITYGISGGVKF
jgi:iron complex outermembrane recepter protein